MDEYAKVTPGKKQLLDIIEALTVDEGLEIVRNRDGSPDSYFVKKTQKITIISKPINK